MRIGLAGNVAQNAYLLAKFLREYEDIDAESFDTGMGAAMQSPYWEHGDFDIATLGPGTIIWNWAYVPIRNGYRRPSWAKIVGQDNSPISFVDEREQREWWGLHGPTKGAALCDPIVNAFSHPVSRLQPYSDMRTPLPDDLVWEEEHPDHPARIPVVTPVFCGRWRTYRALQQQYDLLVLLGAEAANGALLERGSYVTFEHATMRHVEERQSTEQKVLASAYRRAAWNIITNADCHRAAEALGLTNASFIPHPVDTDTFSPQGSVEAMLRAAKLRADLLSWSGAEVIFLCPTRHSRNRDSGSKANEVLLEAYRQYVQVAEPAGAPRAHLLLSMWGADVTISQRLCEDLGIASRVSWYPVLPKVQLADLYRACDVVCDQFSQDVGSFGTITVEGMASSKPVITYINEDIHRWCHDVMPVPPVCNATTPEDVAAWLVRLAKEPGWARLRGAAGYDWVQQYHSPKRVARLHATLYRRLLAERDDAAAPRRAAAVAWQHEREGVPA